MEYIKRLDCKLDMIEMWNCFNKLATRDYHYGAIDIYNTRNKTGQEYINNFVQGVREALDCETTRECFTVQNDDGDIHVHADKCDLSDPNQLHNVYSCVIPVAGSGTTTFYQLDKQFDSQQELYDYVFDNDDLEVAEGVIISDNPYILNISQPHSVEVIGGPRITYHFKISNCEYDIDTIQEKLNARYSGLI